jgi:hypothetical protein
MRCGIIRLCFTCVIGISGFWAPDVAFGRDKIGSVSAVNPSMFGTSQIADRQTMTLGARLIQDHRVETSDAGSGQLLFLDQTSLTVAPNSDLVLDSYIYDPDREVGDVALKLSKGVMRFIGGRISKTRDVRIETPTATVGVRGAIVLIMVKANGRSRICHMAGEYSVVSSKLDGSVTLSRPNACAVATRARVTYEGLISSKELEEIYDLLEGRGTGGQSAEAGPIDLTGIEQINSGEKSGEQNDPVSTSGHSSPEDRADHDDNGIIQDEEIPVAFVNRPPREIPIPIVPIPRPIVPIGQNPIPTVIEGVSGASFQLSTGEFTTFTEVRQGSLIGIGSDGSELRLPVPGTSLDAQNEVELLQGVVGFSPNLGVFEFDFGDVERDPDLGTVTAGSFSSELGDLAGRGVVDLEENFTFVEFVGETLQQSGPNGGFALFGRATQGQAQFFDNSSRPGGFSDADLVSAQDLVDPGSVNTVDAFIIQPALAFSGQTSLGDMDLRTTLDLSEATPLFMIGNHGMARFGDTSTATRSNQGVLQSSGKWLNAVLSLSTDGSAQQSTFLVLADDIKSFTVGGGQTSGPVISSTYLGTSLNANGAETGQDATSLQFGVGTFEDADLNTVFGDANRYLLLSSLHRPDLADGDMSPADPLFEAGGGLSHQHIPDNRANGTNNQFSISSLEAEPFENLAAADNDLSQRIADPLPLAGGRLDASGESGSALGNLQLDRGFATGIARCETGLCGDNGFTSQNFHGLYGVRSSGPTDFRLDFAGGEPTPQPSPGTTTLASAQIENEVTASLRLKSFDAGAVTGAFDGFEVLTNFEFSAGGPTSAVIDDNRFGLTGIGTEARISGQTVSADIALASAGLVGSGGLEFPAGTPRDHEYLRWGWWSATYDVQHQMGNGIDSFASRTDTIHLGTWVAGIEPSSADLIPNNVVGTYDGFALATHANLDTGTTRIVGGDFALEFDFATRAGSVTLNLPAAGLNQTIDVSSRFDPTQYDGFASDGANGTLVNGAFLANPAIDPRTALGDGIAATAGQFDSRNRRQGTRTIGVFGGDRSALRRSVSTPGS